MVYCLGYCYCRHIVKFYDIRLALGTILVKTKNGIVLAMAYSPQNPR